MSIWKDKTTSRVITGVVILVGLGIVGYTWLLAEKKSSPQRTAVTLYNADVPGTSDTPFDHRLLVLSPAELAKAPEARVFTSPLGSEGGAFAYDAQSFGTFNEQRKGNHSGSDLNGIGGENTDEGQPVYAAGRGLLIYSGRPSDDWGNVMVLLHKLPDGTYLQTLYAHLQAMRDFPVGTLVGRGEQIGTVGSADGRYLPHLHFETIVSVAQEAGMPGYTTYETNRVDPTELLARFAPQGAPVPDPVAALRRVQGQVEMEKNLQIETAVKTKSQAQADYDAAVKKAQDRREADLKKAAEKK